VPLAYLTVWELTKSTGAAILGTAFIVFGKSVVISIFFFNVKLFHSFYEVTGIIVLIFICSLFLDHGCITISQYILLDPILMFYIMLATYCFTKFQNCKTM